MELVPSFDTRHDSHFGRSQSPLIHNFHHWDLSNQRLLLCVGKEILMLLESIIDTPCQPYRCKQKKLGFSTFLKLNKKLKVVTDLKTQFQQFVCLLFFWSSFCVSFLFIFFIMSSLNARMCCVDCCTASLIVENEYHDIFIVLSGGINH